MRGHLNSEKRLAWVRRTYSPQVFSFTAQWFFTMGQDLLDIDPERLAWILASLRKNFRDIPGGSRFQDHQRAQLFRSIESVLKGKRTPLDRYLPWYAQWINKHGDGTIGLLHEGVAEPGAPPTIRRVFPQWLQTRPNLQQIAPASRRDAVNDAYNAALDWEQNQLVASKRKKAKEGMQKSPPGVLALQVGDLQIRMLRAKDDSGKPSDLTAVGSYLGHCYQKGGLRKVFQEDIKTNRLRLFTVFSKEGLPLATASVKPVEGLRGQSHAWMPRRIPASRFNDRWRPLSNLRPRLFPGSHPPLPVFTEVKGPQNRTVKGDSPAAHALTMLAKKLWASRANTRPALLGRHPDAAGELLTTLLYGDPRKESSSVQAYLFALGRSTGGRDNRAGLLTKHMPDWHTLVLRHLSLERAAVSDGVQVPRGAAFDTVAAFIGCREYMDAVRSEVWVQGSPQRPVLILGPGPGMLDSFSPGRSQLMPWTGLPEGTKSPKSVMKGRWSSKYDRAWFATGRLSKEGTINLVALVAHLVDGRDGFKFAKATRDFYGQIDRTVVKGRNIKRSPTSQPIQVKAVQETRKARGSADLVVRIADIEKLSGREQERATVRLCDRIRDFGPDARRTWLRSLPKPRDPKKAEVLRKLLTKKLVQ